MLSVKGLQAWYNESHILHGVDLDVREGEVVTLLGRNGAGKTTTLKAIMGIVGKRTGSVVFGGQELIDLSIDRIARLGVAFCPEERAIFASLTVKENLFLPPQIAKSGRDERRADLLALSQSYASGCRAAAASFPAASSRCSRSRESCAPARAF